MSTPVSLQLINSILATLRSSMTSNKMNSNENEVMVSKETEGNNLQGSKIQKQAY